MNTSFLQPVHFKTRVETHLIEDAHRWQPSRTTAEWGCSSLFFKSPQHSYSNSGDAPVFSFRRAAGQTDRAPRRISCPGFGLSGWNSDVIKAGLCRKLIVVADFNLLSGEHCIVSSPILSPNNKCNFENLFSTLKRQYYHIEWRLLCWMTPLFIQFQVSTLWFVVMQVCVAWKNRMNPLRCLRSHDLWPHISMSLGLAVACKYRAPCEPTFREH